MLIGSKLSRDSFHFGKRVFANEIYNKRGIKTWNVSDRIGIRVILQILEQIIFIIMIHQPISVEKFRISDFRMFLSWL